MNFFKQELFWGGFAGILIAVIIFTFSFMGSTVNPTPKDMPLALVVEDEGVKPPTGEQLNFGKMLEEQIKQNDNESVEWTILESREKAINEMNDKNFYASIVIPNDLSQKIPTLLGPSPQNAEVEILINEGLNKPAAAIGEQVANGIIAKLNQQVQTNLYTQVSERQMPLSVEQAQQLAQPISVKTEKLNPVPSYTANGNAPAVFTQIIWLTTFISSMILFTVVKKIGLRWTSLVSQLLGGFIFVSGITGLVFWLANNVLEVTIPDKGGMLILMLFVGLMFYFIQGAFLNWIGYAAAPIFILLFFFSMPVLTLPPEMLPDITKSWLYDWVPFRFSVEAFKDILFFDKNPLNDGIGILGYTALISLLVMSLSVLKPTAKKLEQSKVKEPARGAD
ncbi:YhgE/Pip domain-containing protein [Gracilibacillus salitolerans]|nr:ABC transporter permease [Gracilibacillus salitolerans]